MELIDRYVHAVKFWLPKARRDEIAAELAEDLRSEVEAREDELGRPLAAAELTAIVDRWGSPLVVAQRYLPQRHLIGPAMFPLYRLALKIVALVYLLPWLAAWAVLVVVDQSYRSAGLQPLLSWWLIALHLVVAITVLFVLAERSAAVRARLSASAVASLPPPNPEAIPRSESVGDGLGAVLMLLWWVGVFALPSMTEVGVTLTPILRTLFWPIAIFYTAYAAFSIVNIVRPWWSRFQAGWRLLLNATGVTLITLAVSGGPLIEVHIQDAPADKVTRLQSWANLSLVVTLVIIGLVLAVAAVQDLRRLSGRAPLRHWLIRGRTGQ